MKRLVAPAFALAFAACPGNAEATRPLISVHEVIVKPGDLYQGIQFPEGTRVTIYDASGEVQYVFLGQDFRMGGQLLKRGTQLQIANGKLGSYMTQEGQRIGPIVLNAGAQVIFNDDGSLNAIHPAADTKIQGYLFAAYIWVQFQPNGNVAEGELAENTLGNGLPLKAHTKILFYSNGKI
ncbi:MAG TPA: hypothetical protein VF798_02150 [Burkholderiaceae bacterium]